MKNEELDRLIEKSFHTEPGFALPADFANKLTVNVMHCEQWKTDMREYLILTGIVSLLLVITSAFYCFVDPMFPVKALVFLSDNLISVIAIAVLLNFILFADKVLLRLLFSRYNKAS